MMKSKKSFDIIETHESPSHKKTSHQARTKKRAIEREAPTRFICVDGEGVTDENGNHRYVLLGIGKDQIENPDGLSWQEIFSFLYEHFLDRRAAYCGYFLGYDFTQWIRDLPEYKATRLIKDFDKRKRQTKGSYALYWPVDCDGWEFDIMPNMKRIKIRPQGEKTWMYICDAGGFFQMSFLKAIDPENHHVPIVTQEEYADLRRGKNARGSAALDDNMRHYNRKENEVCARLLESLDSGFREMGIKLRYNQWFGPGQVAQEWLKERIPPSSDMLKKVPEYFIRAARDSYFGGWFEIMAHGIIPGVTHEYDINSAYPSIIAQLPCLLHGTYTRGEGKPPDSRYCLVYAVVWSSKPGNDVRKPIGSMLHRQSSGRIYRPQVTEGWYWKHELDAAIRAGMVVPPRKDQYIRWVAYNPCSCRPPLSEVADLYNLRQRAGKKTPLGIAAKLAYNSMYGKFAQSVGNPRFGNPIYASLITAGCRTIITDAIATHPRKQDDCIMIATDGVYFTSEHPGLTISKELGEWDHGTKTNICLFKPGMYWDDNARNRIRKGEAPVFKSRGISARAFASQIDRVDAQFYHFLESESVPESLQPHLPISKWPSVEFPIGFSMTTARIALHRNQWETAGKVTTDSTGKQSSDPWTKRQDPYFNGYIRSKPLEAPFDLLHPQGPRWASFKSQPYKKQFGIEDPWSTVSEEIFGMTPDGHPITELYDALGMKGL